MVDKSIQKTLDLYREGIIIDGLNASNHSDSSLVKKIHKGGVTAVNATIAAWHTPDETEQRYKMVCANIEQNKGIARQVFSTRDILRCKEDNKLGYIFGFQGTGPIGNRLDLLDKYYEMGLRIIQLTYNSTNLVGSGCMTEDKGLTNFGKQVIKRMNELGILIDLSHCGPLTTLQAIEYSDKQVAFTHANPIVICETKRNKSNELLKLLSERGGVAGAVVFPSMLNCDNKATLDDYLNLIDYMVNLMGIDHVGLGPDFMENMLKEDQDKIMNALPQQIKEKFLSVEPVKDFENAGKFANVAEGLNQKGYKDEEIKKIMGLNWLNLYDKVW